MSFLIQNDEERTTYQGPIRHINDSSTSATNSKREHEDHYLGSTIQRRGHEEVVLAEPPGPVSPQVVLREDSQAEGRKDGAVDTNAKVAQRP